MKKKLKIAMFFSYDPSQAGGVQEHIRLLSNSLRDLGHLVDIYGPEKNIHKFINYYPIAKSIKIPVPNGSWANITLEKNKIKKVIDTLNKKKYDIEAMATGTPIVGFNNSAFKEILKGYPCPDLLIKSKDVDKLAQAIEKLIKDINKRKEISSWLIKESKKYSWEKSAKETEEFYYQILNRNE